MEELARLLQNLIRLGTIIAVQHSNPPRVRVSTGDIQTNWLPWLESRAGSGRSTWDPPSIGEQVIVLSPGGDLTGAFVLLSVNSDASPPPSNSPDKHISLYRDGAQVEYDYSTGEMNISGIKSLTISAATEVNINCPVININGALNLVTGKPVTMSGEFNIDGSIIQNNGTIESNGVVLDEHKHSGVTAGGSNTGDPVK